MAAANTKKLALSALFVALILIFFYAQLLLKTTKLSLLVLMSFVVGLGVVLCHLRYGLMIWASASLLSFFLSPYKISVLLFVLLFGLYPIFLFYTQLKHKKKQQVFLKIAYALLLSLILYLFLFLFFPGLIAVKVPIYVLLPGFFLGFFVYERLMVFYYGWLLKQSFVTQWLKRL